MNIKNLLFAIFTLIFIPVLTYGQILNKIFDNQDIMNPNKSMDEYVMVDRLSPQEKETIKIYFDPFYVDYIYAHKLSGSTSDIIKINSIGYSKGNEIIKGIFVSVVFNEEILKYLNDKFGTYHNIISFGPADKSEKNNTYNWESPTSFISLYINKHSTNNAIIIIRNK